MKRVAPVLTPAVMALFLAAHAPQDTSPLTFNLEVKRTHHGVRDTVVIVATAKNTSPSVFTGWVLFEFSGEYKPSRESMARWEAIRDSIEAAMAQQTEHLPRCHIPRFPFFLIAANGWFEPFENVFLEPGEVYSDTLIFGVYLGDFQTWPGEVEARASFLIADEPWGREEARRFQGIELKAGVSVP